MYSTESNMYIWVADFIHFVTLWDVLLLRVSQSQIKKQVTINLALTATGASRMTLSSTLLVSCPWAVWNLTVKGTLVSPSLRMPRKRMLACMLPVAMFTETMTVPTPAGPSRSPAKFETIVGPQYWH